MNVEPGDSFAAGGLYLPAPEVLARLRQEIDYDLPAFEGLLRAPAFAQHFRGLSQEQVLQRPPKGYDAANPALPYLKLKSFTASRPLLDADASQPGFVTQITTAFAGLQPLVAFLNKALD